MSLKQASHAPATSGIDFESIDADYFQHRQLKKGAADWVLLVGPSVAYVISGNYADWSSDLARGGWGEMFLATLLMVTMHLCICFSLAELSSVIPTASGGYGFTHSVFGPWGGFLTNATILIKCATAPAAIACFIGAYCESLFGVGSWLIYLVFYIVFIGIHILDTGEALKLMFVITAMAAIALGIFIVAMLPHFDSANLSNIPQIAATGASSFLSFGYAGVWAVIPYATWLFLAVEGVPLAAEKTKNPKRDLPRGLIGAMLVLLVFAALILVVGPRAARAKGLMGSGNPSVEALKSTYKGSTQMNQFVNLVDLTGLIVSFFSIIYAYSWQIFAPSRVGYLPRSLSLTNHGKAPVLTPVMPEVVGFGLSLIDQGNLLILVAVFSATISYVLVMATYITLRIRRLDMQRPYHTPGDILASGIILVLACVTVVAGFLVGPRVVVGMVAIYAVLIGYFALYSRHRLASGTPEEGFAVVQAAEQDLR